MVVAGVGGGVVVGVQETQTGWFSLVRFFVHAVGVVAAVAVAYDVNLFA